MGLNESTNACLLIKQRDHSTLIMNTTVCEPQLSVWCDEIHLEYMCVWGESLRSQIAKKGVDNVSVLIPLHATMHTILQYNCMQAIAESCEFHGTSLSHKIHVWLEHQN